jgi:hypothetical protein
MWVGDGKGGMKRANPTITHIKIGLPGQNITIDDEKGITIEKDQETGMFNIHAESILINNETKPKRSFFERLFRRKEG